MKKFNWSNKKRLTCGFACECGEEMQKSITYSTLPIPNKLADCSFNQEIVADVEIKCSSCGTLYTLELYRDIKTGWVRIWNDKTATLVEDTSLNITQQIK